MDYERQLFLGGKKILGMKVVSCVEYYSGFAAEKAVMTFIGKEVSWELIRMMKIFRH